MTGHMTELLNIHLLSLPESWGLFPISLTHWHLGCLTENLIRFQLTLVSDGWWISREIALKIMSLDLTDDTSALVQVMAWCRLALKNLTDDKSILVQVRASRCQAISHYLNQCWPRSMLWYDHYDNATLSEVLAHNGSHLIFSTSFKILSHMWHKHFSSELSLIKFLLAPGHPDSFITSPGVPFINMVKQKS